MAKKSQLERNARRRRTVAKYAEKRAALKAVIANQQATEEEKQQARNAMQDLPRAANPNRVKNRCLITGRSRAVYRKFGISRLKFRELALWGLIPGVRKASW